MEDIKDFMAQKTKIIFGQTYELRDIKRVLGGAQKHTYLAETQNGFKFIIYIWDKTTSYFSYNEEKDIFLSSSARLFELNHMKMSQRGVRVPKLYYINRSREEQPYAYAFVEYIEGSDMDEIISHDKSRLKEVLGALKENISKLHNERSEHVGQINHLQDAAFDIIKFSLNEARININALSEMDAENAELYAEIGVMLEVLAKGIVPRATYTFIHGELGPNHVMVNSKNETVLIDIEGAKYADVEEEASFLKIRFGDAYGALVNKENLDEQRMKFYYIGHCLGNLSGSMTLKHKGYYDMADINGIIDYFTVLLKKVVIGKDIW